VFFSQQADSYLITLDQPSIAANQGFSDTFTEVPVQLPYTYACFFDIKPGKFITAQYVQYVNKQAYRYHCRYTFSESAELMHGSAIEFISVCSTS